MIRAALFDMDGTILDTARDLCDGVNYALRESGHFHDYTVAEACRFFGSGVRVAFQRALAAERGISGDALLSVGEGDAVPDADEAAEIERLVAVYAPYYKAHCNDHTRPYPGVPEAVKALRAAGLRTAVLSNKPDAAVQILSRGLFPGLFDLSLGETPEVPRKPAPDSLLFALNAWGLTRDEAVYIGDSEIDLLAAKNAGIRCIAVSWGFRSEAYLRSLGAKTIVHTAEELVKEILEAA